MSSASSAQGEGKKLQGSQPHEGRARSHSRSIEMHLQSLGIQPSNQASEPLEVQVAVEAQGRSVPEPDQGAPRDLLEPLGDHIRHACKIPIGFVEKRTR